MRSLDPRFLNILPEFGAVDRTPVSPVRGSAPDALKIVRGAARYDKEGIDPNVVKQSPVPRSAAGDFSHHERLHTPSYTELMQAIGFELRVGAPL